MNHPLSNLTQTGAPQTRRSRSRTTRCVAVIGAALLLVTACGSDDEASSSTDASEADAPASSDPSSTDPQSTAELAAMPAPGAAVDLLIGPEGGFDDDELAVARAAGFRPVRLGPRVLRTETAGLVALAVLQSHWGDLAASRGP